MRQRRDLRNPKENPHVATLDIGIDGSVRTRLGTIALVSVERKQAEAREKAETAN